MALLTTILVAAVLGFIVATSQEDDFVLGNHGLPETRARLAEEWEGGVWGFFGWGRRTVKKTRQYGGYRRVSG